MSRIGKQPVAIPAGVKVTINGTNIKVEGAKAKLEQTLHPNMKVTTDGKTVNVARPDDARQNRALHGLTRALINNMVVGVSTGYTKRLKIEGVGYQAAMKGKGVELTVGYANRILHTPPEGITVGVPDPTTIVVTGADKKPEPYKGKGVRYEGEKVRIKEGKSFSQGK
jgi:large subunit ribosomal protein L6